MLILSVALAVPFIGFTVLLLWFDHVTSGKYKKGYGEVIWSLGTFVIVVWGFSDSLIQVSPLLVALALGALIRGVSYTWYRGQLKDVRRRRVEKLRAKWQKELDWLEYQDEVLEKEAFVLGSCSSTTRDSHSSHNAWLATQNEKKKKDLLWKLKHIIP